MPLPWPCSSTESPPLPGPSRLAMASVRGMPHALAPSTGSLPALGAGDVDLDLDSMDVDIDETPQRRESVPRMAMPDWMTTPAQVEIPLRIETGLCLVFRADVYATHSKKLETLGTLFSNSCPLPPKNLLCPVPPEPQSAAAPKPSMEIDRPHPEPPTPLSTLTPGPDPTFITPQPLIPAYHAVAPAASPSMTMVDNAPELPDTALTEEDGMMDDSGGIYYVDGQGYFDAEGNFLGDTLDEEDGSIAASDFDGAAGGSQKSTGSGAGAEDDPDLDPELRDRAKKTFAAFDFKNVDHLMARTLDAARAPEQSEGSPRPLSRVPSPVPSALDSMS